jgi:poly-beta-1,6-N-acetyl-D-glucosamine synthase
LPPILGWDSIDETSAHMHGWHVRNAEFPNGYTLHMRSTGSYDGAVRGYRRRGVAAWAYGAHPLNVLVSGILRMRDRPRVVGGLAYLAGWLEAAARRAPRADRDLVEFKQAEQLRRLRQFVLRGQAA